MTPTAAAAGTGMRTSDLDINGKLLATVPIEPLVLRARAGECMMVTLPNRMPATPDLDGYNTLPMLDRRLQRQRPPAVELRRPAPADALLRRQPLRRRQLGGNNDPAAWRPGQSIDLQVVRRRRPDQRGRHGHRDPDRVRRHQPDLLRPHRAREQGGDRRADHRARRGPTGPSWRRPAPWPTSPDPTPVTGQQSSFREFVVLFQNDVGLRTDRRYASCGQPTGGVVPGYGAPIENLGCGDDAEDSGQKGLNYRTEPLWKRMQHAPGTPFVNTDDFNDWNDVLSNTMVGGATPRRRSSPAAPGRAGPLPRAPARRPLPQHRLRAGRPHLGP